MISGSPPSRNLRRAGVDDLTGHYVLNCVHQNREQWTVVFHPVLRDVNDDDPEPKFLEIVLVLKTLVDGYQNVTPALGLGDQLGIRERAPLGFGHG